MRKIDGSIVQKFYRAVNWENNEWTNKELDARAREDTRKNKSTLEAQETSKANLKDVRMDTTM